MISNLTSIQKVYTRIFSVLGLSDDNYKADIYEFIGWAMKEAAIGIDLEMKNKELEVEGHRVALPCDFFRLSSLCFNGKPMIYSTQSFAYDYLVCDSCFQKSNSTITKPLVRVNNTMSNIAADYVSNDGLVTVNINQVVMVSEGHTSGGTAGDYYKKVNLDITTNLKSTDFSDSTQWRNISDQLETSTETWEYDDSTYSGNNYFYIDPGYIKTSMETGTIEVSYESIPTDDEGYFMVPDDQYYLWYLEYYCKVRLIQSKGLTFPQEDLRICRVYMEEYLGRAKANNDRMTIAQLETFTNRWTRPLQVMNWGRHFHKPLPNV